MTGNKHNHHYLLIAFAVLALLIGSFSEWSVTAQKPEKADLFIEIDRTKTDLTPEQQQALSRIRSQETTVETRLVRVRTQLLTPSPLKLRVNLGKEFEVEKTETKPRDEGLTWIGKPLSATDSAVLVVNGNDVTGTVRSGSELYAIRPLGGGLHAVIRQDEKKFPPEHPPEFKPVENEAPKPLPGAIAADLPQAPQTLRVLVAYTPKVAAAVHDVDAMIRLAVEETNLGYANSNINLRAELAYEYQVNYQESGSHDTDLMNFRTPNDSLMDEVHQLRDTHKADVCVLLIDNPSYCGLASAILADENSAFAVVHYTCATGYYSFAHEIGHLQGARHNPEADPTMLPFSYGHGYSNPTANWRTIMSYDCPNGCPRLPYWANPQVKYHNLAMGDGDCCNDSRVLNETASTITAFRN